MFSKYALKFIGKIQFYKKISFLLYNDILCHYFICALSYYALTLNPNLITFNNFGISYLIQQENIYASQLTRYANSNVAECPHSMAFSNYTSNLKYEKKHLLYFSYNIKL